MPVHTYEVVLKFSDAVEHTIQVPAGTSILEAALAQDVAILHRCQSGSCGSCVGKLTVGDAKMRANVAASLLDSEKQEGLRLTCVCEALSDCTIAFDYESDAANVTPDKVSVFINAIEWLAEDVVKLELELADGDWLSFQPGQFVQVKVPDTNHYRRYSIASAPEELPRFELLIRVLPDGVMSDYLRADAKIDDVLEVEGPFGSFFWRANMQAPHLFIAGGTGLAPMMAMLEVIRSSNKKKPKMLMSFGCRDKDSLFYREELALREFWMPTFEHRVSIDSGEELPGISLGNPVEAITEGDVCADTVAYLCGPPQMVARAYEHLEKLGVNPKNIFAEQFVASE